MEETESDVATMVIATTTVTARATTSTEIVAESKTNNKSSIYNNGNSSFLESLSSVFSFNARKNPFHGGSLEDKSNNKINKNGGRGSRVSSSSFSSSSISELSVLANSVVSRCAAFLATSAQELQCWFEEQMPENVKQPSVYARNFLEFCSYQALSVVTTSRVDYLCDKEFRHLSFDMMVAWEAPGVENETLDHETISSSEKEPTEDDGGWSLFYSSSTNMAVQVDNKRTVGPEAFARIAPACPIIADITTVHNLFDVLTSPSAHRLHFLIYDKYLHSLEKVLRAVHSGAGPQSVSNLSLAENEIILDVDGTVPTQPVLQHVGISAWPGRLTLTNYALYFESGVGLYDKAVRYDLAIDMKQIIKPELTGPLGARLFDKAVMYKSISVAEPVFFEFPEFKGSSRRDYWLDISLEVLRAHKFIRKYNLKEHQRSEALARAILGILRYRAVREAFSISSTSYKAILCFNLSESLPRGDMILENLSRRLLLMGPRAVRRDSTGSPNFRKQVVLPVALLALSRLGIILFEEPDISGEATFQVGDVRVGEISPLETAVKQSKQDTGRAEAAQASVDQVKVEGIDTNLAVMKELLLPIIGLYNWLQTLASWRYPIISMAFLVLISYMILRGSIKYFLPSVFIYIAIIMVWRRLFNRGKLLEPYRIIAPPSKNAVEQLLTLQDAIAQVEALIQSCNIVLLKVRALLFAVVPQATDKVVLSLIFLAVAVAFVPLKYIILFVFLEPYTRSMPLRKDSSDRWVRRIREWWIRIPAAPVQLIRDDDKKKK